MSLDPNARASWQGLMDLLRPPSGYRLEAAVATTFGLSFDALVASLLAMLDADGDGLVQDPLASLIAATRLAARVRVFVQAGTISGNANGIPPRLAGLLDRMIIPIQARTGVFHPKIWVLWHKPLSESKQQEDTVRLIVGSRNLAPSTALELCTVVDGDVGDGATSFGGEVARALSSCFRLEKSRCAGVNNLPSILERTVFQIPDDGKALCHFLWQGFSGDSHFARLPQLMERAIVLSPFLSAEFLDPLLSRSASLRVISTPTAYRKLRDSTFAALQERAKKQKSVVMYVVRDDCGDDDDGRVDGIHGKLLLVDQGKGVDTITFIGSANATGPGWGVTGARNVETLLELRPGISIDQFTKEFLLGKHGEPQPWIREFESDDRIPLSDEERLQERLVNAARRLAGMQFGITYNRVDAILTVRLLDGEDISWVTAEVDMQVDFAPFGMSAEFSGWTSLRNLAMGAVAFTHVDLSQVTAFVELRVKSGDGLPIVRLALGRLELTSDEIEARDEAARVELAASATTEQILAALIFGVSHSRTHLSRLPTDGAAQRSSSTSELFTQVSLERMLEAIAVNPDILREIHLLLNARTDEAFVRFREDIEAALGLRGVPRGQRS